MLFDCRTFSVGFDVITVSETVPNGPGSFTKKSSGDFRLVHNFFLLFQLIDLFSVIYTNCVYVLFNCHLKGTLSFPAICPAIMPVFLFDWSYSSKDVHIENAKDCLMSCLALAEEHCKHLTRPSVFSVLLCHWSQLWFLFFCHFSLLKFVLIDLLTVPDTHILA